MTTSIKPVSGFDLDPVTKPARRSRKQIAADENAVIAIGSVVTNVNRYDVSSLRESLDEIADILVEAGRL